MYVNRVSKPSKNLNSWRTAIVVKRSIGTCVCMYRPFASVYNTLSTVYLVYNLLRRMTGKAIVSLSRDWEFFYSYNRTLSLAKLVRHQVFF